MTPKHRSLLTALVALGMAGVADAGVPDAEDVALCNNEARDAARQGSGGRTASPNAKDENRAAVARRDAAPTDATGSPTRSPDPQLDGMDAEGAKDPVYQAVFRTCMRTRGF